jgi:hypothetical protein
VAQLAQIVGALLILAAYVLAQFGVLDQRSYWYLWLNLVGAAALTVSRGSNASGASCSSRAYGRP